MEKLHIQVISKLPDGFHNLALGFQDGNFSFTRNLIGFILFY